MKTEEKWIKKWQDARIFEAAPNDKKKFFGTFPYPYVNSYLHLGHFYSSMRLEALSRYKRMRGFNVLYAQGWHCTGSPIVSAAKRVEENEPKQVGILKMQGFSDDQIKEFADPKKWIEFFPKEAKKDFTDMGYSIDFRRSFITTDMNPSYDKFITWQFNRLKEKNYVIRGKFPVVWDPKDNVPVGDHDRIDGEGETPQEYVIYKQPLKDGRLLISATLKPDTVLGITNMFVNPDSELVEAKVNSEVWILSEKAAHELSFQDKKVEITNRLKGSDLIGKTVRQFNGLDVLVLPANFVNTNVGTGIVHSCPSDSADDLIALMDLIKDADTLNKFNLKKEDVEVVKPIPIIDIEGYSKIPAEDIIKRFNIVNQHDAAKLKEAKKELYGDGYYKGKFNDKYTTKYFLKNYVGLNVLDHKDEIKQELIDKGFADVYYQLTGKVLARSLSECVVKIVDDQWFMAYGSEEWKKLAHECLDNMKLYPEKTRSQFNYVLDWLRNWACTREFGLGTKLPWDKKWLIESLSDSTIYMAYYTISHKIQSIDANKLDDNFFDYIFLGKGDGSKLLIDETLAEQLKEEFEYWYPMDFRTTGKDLIQNHMSFSIFNHCAIFPKKHWPISFGLNGHVLVDGDKMSKSKGNFITMRQAFIDYGADASRFTALSGGEGVDDANFDREMAKSMVQKMNSMIDFAKENYGKGRKDKLSIDKWFEAKISEVIIETTRCYEETIFRSAIQSCYFDLQNALKWYMRRCLNNPNKEVISYYIEVQALLLAPITPFTSEEIWENIGKKSFIASVDWPVAHYRGETAPEEFVKETMDDINSVLKLVKNEPKKITLFISEEWKYALFEMLKSEIKESRDFKTIMQKIMAEEEFKKHSKDVPKIIEKSLKSGIRNFLWVDEEYKIIEESLGFFGEEFGCEVNVLKAEDSTEAKSKQAQPGKVAIFVE